MMGVRESAMSQIARIRVRDGVGPNAIGTGRLRTASGLSVFFSAMAATASTPPKGFGNSSSDADVQTGNSLCDVTGGVAPYTYLWEEVSSTGTWTIIQNTASFTGFIAEAVTPFDTRDAEFKCTVTDANGEEAVTNTVTARAINLGGGL